MAHHCRVCDRWFKRTVDLDQHIRDSPYHREPYCAPCDRFFVDYNALQNHLDNSRFHTGWDDEEKETEEYYSSDDEAYCEKCNRSFVDEYSLGQHLERSDAHKPVLTKTPPNLHVAITPVAAQVCYRFFCTKSRHRPFLRLSPTTKTAYPLVQISAQPN